ncbi:MAG TPA: amino acid ABC transporter permease [Leucothrix mucor]|nr:amino acid ABC transporter permease [Leucothrix mucor]
MYITDKILPELPAPSNSKGLVHWIKTNLFSSPLNILMTFFGLFLIYKIIPPAVQWAFIDATWVADTREECLGDGKGACWAYIGNRFGQVMYGFYPPAEYWRPNLAAILLIVLTIPLFIERMPKKIWLGAFILLVFPFIAYFLIHGGSFGLSEVGTNKWGGLMLTLIISLVGIAAALPLGIILALGRRSEMPIVKSICVIFIEFWRGVPLITVLFMASVMLPLFLPEGSDFDKLARAMIGIILFQAAYVAEVVRGGLQAIPKGQYEAAISMGLSYWKSMGLIILPQALKLVIPGLVNTFIALFKDTTLVLIIGLFDLLAIIENVLGSDSSWLGFFTEGLVFAAFVFWIFCFSMSRYSMALERKLDTGHKH